MARSDYDRYGNIGHERYGMKLRGDEKIPQRGLEFEYDRQYADNRARKHDERGFIDRAGDEVLSWLGDEEADRRRRIDALEKERRNRHQSEYQRGKSSLRDLHIHSNTRAGNVMTKSVVCVSPSDTVKRAARLMGECDCGSLPVVDRNGRLIGMITDRDIAIRVVGRGMDSRAHVYDCMTDEAFACNEYDSVEDCLRLMAHHQIRRLPIVNNYGHVIGIVSQGDLAIHAAENSNNGERRAVANMLSEVSEPTSEAYRQF